MAEPLFLLADSAIVGHLGTGRSPGWVSRRPCCSPRRACSSSWPSKTSVVARRLGAGDLPGALGAGVDGLWLALVLGAVTAVGVAVGAPALCAAFGASAEVQEQAATYLRISALGIPGMLVVLGATGLLRGLQDTRTPLVVAVGGFGLNIALNLLLVYGVGLGIAGSALGTVVAQTGMAVALVVRVVRQARPLGAPMRPHPAGVLRAALGGLPLLVRTLALRGVIVVTTVVAARYGDEALAAHQVVATVWSALAFALDALAIAAQALTGKALGAGDAAGARDAARTMARWGVGAGVLTGIVLVPLGAVIGRGFSTDPVVVTTAGWTFVVVGLVQWLAGNVFVVDGRSWAPETRCGWRWRWSSGGGLGAAHGAVGEWIHRLYQR